VSSLASGHRTGPLNGTDLCDTVALVPDLKNEKSATLATNTEQEDGTNWFVLVGHFQIEMIYKITR